jgi:hypothetical protein
MHATAAQPVANIDLEQFDDGRHGAARDHSKRTSELQTYWVLPARILLLDCCLITPD